MPHRNTNIFTIPKGDSLPRTIYNLRFIIAVALAVLLLLSGCSKTAVAQANKNLLEQYFEDNILNRDFVVQLATDTSKDLTNQFNGYTFKLTKNTLLDGPMTATTGSTTLNGTWASNDDYSKLTISLPNSVTVFSFINRDWKFTKKAIPVMELAPWGTTDPKVLHMQRL